MSKFYKTVTVPASSDSKRTGISPRKYFLGFTLSIIIIIMLGYFFFLFGSLARTINANWQEIKFAYERPSIVKTVRVDYEAQQKKMEQSFLKKDKTSEERLVDEVVKKLQSAEVLK